MSDENEVQLAPQLTVADLGLTAGEVAAAKWKAAQYVEPDRNGEPWCTQEDAEDMLVRAAFPILSVMGQPQYTKYALFMDEQKSILTLSIA